MRYLPLLLVLLCGLTSASPLPAYRALPKPLVLLIAGSTSSEGLAEALRSHGAARVTFAPLDYNDLDLHHLCDKPLEEAKADTDYVQQQGKAFVEQQLARLDQFDVVIASFQPRDAGTQAMQRTLADYVRQGGNLVFINPSWETTFQGTPIGEVLPVKEGTAKAWTGGALGAAAHPLTRGLPFETIGAHWYGPIYEPVDATCQPLTLNKGGAQFWYRRLPGAGQTVHCYQVGGGKWQWGGSNAAQYLPDRPDDAALWQAFYPRLLYGLTYGAKAFPVLGHAVLPENTVAQTGAPLRIPVEVENVSDRDLPVTVVVTVALRRSSQTLTATQKGVVKAGERVTITANPTIELPNLDPNVRVIARVLDDTEKFQYAESTAWLPFTHAVPLAVTTGKASFLPSEPIPITVNWAGTAQPGAYTLHAFVVDRQGRVLRKVSAPITVAAGMAGTWSGKLAMPDWGPEFVSCYWVTAMATAGTKVAGVARAQVQLDRPWTMREQFQWSLWSAGGDPQRMALIRDAGFNALGYPGNNALADRYAMRQYVEGSGINTFSVTIDHDNWEAVRAAMEKTLAKQEKDGGPDARSKALVSLGEESGFEGGWGRRYYWKDDIAPAIPQKVFGDYLRERYEGKIAVLNEEWGTQYTDFSEIPLERSKVKAPANVFMAAQAWEAAQKSGKPADKFPVDVAKIDAGKKYLALTAPYYESNRFFDWYYQKYCDLTTEVYRTRNPVPRTIMSAPGGFYPKVDIFNFDGMGPFYPKEGGLVGNAIARRGYGDEPGFSGAMWAYFDLRSLWNSTVMSSIIAGNTHIDYWVDSPLTYNQDNTHTRASFWTKELTAQLKAVEPLLLQKRFACTKGLGMYIPPQPVGNGVIGGHFGSSINPNAPLYSALEESGYLPKVVNTDDLKDIQVLVASHAQVVSVTEGRQLMNFVQNGGLLVTTPWLASCSPHGNVLSVYPSAESGLADLLGVRWLNTSQQAKNEPVTVTLPGLGLAAPLELVSRGWDTPQEIAPDVEVLTKYKDGTPLLLARQVGKGRVVMLNMMYDWSGWWNSFHEPSREAYRQLIDGILRTDGRVRREYFVGFNSAEAAADNKGWWGMVMKTTPQPGQSIPWWASQLFRDPSGTVKYLGIYADHRSPKISGTVRWQTPNVRFVDMLTGREVPSKNGEAPLTLRPGEAALWAITPWLPTAVKVIAPAKITAGEPLALAVQLPGAPAALSCGMVVDVFAPSGARVPALSPANVTLTGGKGTVTIPTAFNDPAGSYRIVVTESLTRKQAETTVTLAASGGVPGMMALTPFPPNPGDARQQTDITGEEFLGLLRQLRTIYSGDYTGLEERYMLSYYQYVAFRPENRHATMRQLQRVDWTPHLATMAAALRAGERFVLVGEDLNIDPQSGLRIDPLAVANPSAFLDALAKLPGATRTMEEVDGIRCEVIRLGTGTLVIAHTSLERTTFHSSDVIAWHTALKAALTKVK